MKWNVVYYLKLYTINHNWISSVLFSVVYAPSGWQCTTMKLSTIITFIIFFFLFLNSFFSFSIMLLFLDFRCSFISPQYLFSHFSYYIIHSLFYVFLILFYFSFIFLILYIFLAFYYSPFYRFILSFTISSQFFLLFKKKFYYY